MQACCFKTYTHARAHTHTHKGEEMAKAPQNGHEMRLFIYLLHACVHSCGALACKCAGRPKFFEILWWRVLG